MAGNFGRLYRSGYDGRKCSGTPKLYSTNRQYFRTAMRWQNVVGLSSGTNFAQHGSLVGDMQADLFTLVARAATVVGKGFALATTRYSRRSADAGETDRN